MPKRMSPQAAALGGLAMLAACVTPQSEYEEAAAGPISGVAAVERTDPSDVPRYIIGPSDALQVFVWQAPELTTNVVVRPDGRISTPLVEDMLAAGKTPTELSNDIETALREYVKSPEVTVIVDNPVGTQQVRIIGEVQQDAAIPYEANMTILDVMLRVGGLTEFAAGNRTKLIRNQGTSTEATYRVRLNDLMRRGDVSANVPVLPGDVIIVPQSRF